GICQTHAEDAHQTKLHAKIRLSGQRPLGWCDKDSRIDARSPDATEDVPDLQPQPRVVRRYGDIRRCTDQTRVRPIGPGRKGSGKRITTSIRCHQLEERLPSLVRLELRITKVGHPLVEERAIRWEQL